MRLTLRTLLAYLDNTLEPADAEILRQKVAESGFATQLVQKIRQKLSDPDLPAPSPEAIGPVHDANVISEYLDSTLPHEQVAEIERACLEIDANLSEAAACHQILTMVLGNRADVPPELRQRIYSLPDREIEKLAASSDRFSSLSIENAPTHPIANQPAEAGSVSPGGTPNPDGAPGPDRPTAHPLHRDEGGRVRGVAPESVRPVDISDSGVFDAPTRLRESGVIPAGDTGFGSSAGPASRALSKEDRIYGGSIRPSRITPWLVSLGIVAALLFAMVQIFRPLLTATDETTVAGLDAVSDAIVSIEPPTITGNLADPSSVETIPPPASSTITKPTPANSTAQKPAGETTTAVEAVSPSVSPMTQDNMDLASPTTPALDSDTLDTSAIAGPDAKKVEPSSEPSAFAEPSALAGPLPAAMIDSESAEVSAEADVMTDASGVTVSPDMTSDSVSPESKTNDPELSESKIAIDPGMTIATIDGSETLIASRNQDRTWTRFGDEGQIKIGTPVICAPMFRGKMMFAGNSSADVSGAASGATSSAIEMIGPTGLQWESTDTGEFQLKVDFGRLLITSKAPASTLSVQLGNTPVTLVFPEQETTVATSIKHFRKPGLNPLESGQASELLGILTVQGSVSIQHSDKTSELVTGQQWIKRGDGPAMVSTFAEPPDWIAGPDPDAATLASSARSGLLELVKQNESVERSLREATLFRRSEVAALAAKTLLQLDQSDVYFGGDGILSQPKQRQYWPEHYASLMESLDRGPEQAEQMMRSIAKMDAANAPVLYRLLVGYSQKQLADGGDEQLVGYLDSESMAVRVLALENLHQITGTTLYFRAETDSRVRRTPAIRKWMVRQKKGDIRWPAGE